jgi:hypothetical protein
MCGDVSLRVHLLYTKGDERVTHILRNLGRRCYDDGGVGHRIRRRRESSSGVSHVNPWRFRILGILRTGTNTGTNSGNAQAIHKGISKLWIFMGVDTE